MITCSEINHYLRDPIIGEGKRVLAQLPGIDVPVDVLRARVGLGNQLQVRVKVDGQEVWRTVDYQAISVVGREKE
jgi:hypothetical protein